MNINKALLLSLGDLEGPVVTFYDFGRIVYSLYKSKEYKGEPLSHLKRDCPDRSAVKKYLTDLVDQGILSAYPGFPKDTVFSFIGRSGSGMSVEAGDVACAVDPFGYVSHLSAMEYYGLTDRMLTVLHISSPADRNWKSFAMEKMKKDLGGGLDEYLESNLPRLSRTRLQKVGRKPIKRTASVHLGAFRALRGRAMRVSTIGRTFLDMLKRPELCGGIGHVLDVYDEHARNYVQLIIDEVNQHGGAIDKVRSGYILEERLGVSDPQIDAWIKFAERGGSRKLDASNEYEPRWSDKWCLSLNVVE